MSHSVEELQKKQRKKDVLWPLTWDAADLRVTIKGKQLCLLLISSDEDSTASLPFISAAMPAAWPPLGRRLNDDEAE